MHVLRVPLVLSLPVYEYTQAVKEAEGLDVQIPLKRRTNCFEHL